MSTIEDERAAAASCLPTVRSSDNGDGTAAIHIDGPGGAGSYWLHYDRKQKKAVSVPPGTVTPAALTSRYLVFFHPSTGYRIFEHDKFKDADFRPLWKVGDAGPHLDSGPSAVDAPSGLPKTRNGFKKYAGKLWREAKNNTTGRVGDEAAQRIAKALDDAGYTMKENMSRSNWGAIVEHNRRRPGKKIEKWEQAVACKIGDPSPHRAVGRTLSEAARVK